MLNNHKASHEKRKGRGVGGELEGWKRAEKKKGAKEKRKEVKKVTC